MSKPTLALDFDGVLHRYSRGWDDGSIYDTPVEGAVEFVSKAQKSFKVVVVSSRCADHAGAMEVKAWLEKYEFPDGVEVCVRRPPAYVTLDDRAVTFTGTWPDMEALLAFRPWHAS